MTREVEEVTRNGVIEVEDTTRKHWVEEAGIVASYLTVIIYTIFATQAAMGPPSILLTGILALATLLGATWGLELVSAQRDRCSHKLTLTSKSLTVKSGARLRRHQRTATFPRSHVVGLSTRVEHNPSNPRRDNDILVVTTRDPHDPLALEQTHEFPAIKSPVELSTLPDEDLEDPRAHFARSVPDGVKLANLMLIENPGDIAAAQQLTEQVRDRYGFLLADYTTLMRMPAAISSTFAPNSEFLESLVALDDAKSNYERRRTDTALATWRGAAEEAQARLRILEDSAREAGIVELPNPVRGQFLTIVARVEKARTLADTTTNTAEKDAAQRAVADLLASVHGLLNTKTVSDGRIQLLTAPEREPIGIRG